MSAREELVAGLSEHSCCFDDEDVGKLVDAFAHELAERIRRESSDQWDRGNQSWDTDDAADFIDTFSPKPPS